MYYRMFSSIPSHLLKASSPLSSRDNQKRLQTLPNVPRAAEWPFIETCVSGFGRWTANRLRQLSAV